MTRSPRVYSLRMSARASGALSLTSEGELIERAAEPVVSHHPDKPGLRAGAKAERLPVRLRLDNAAVAVEDLYLKPAQRRIVQRDRIAPAAREVPQLERVLVKAVGEAAIQRLPRLQGAGCFDRRVTVDGNPHGVVRREGVCVAAGAGNRVPARAPGAALAAPVAVF